MNERDFNDGKLELNQFWWRFSLQAKSQGAMIINPPNVL